MSYFKYCENSLKSFRVSDKSDDLYIGMCKEMYMDYSNHTLLKKTINKFYDFLVYQTNMDENDINLNIKKVEIPSLRMMMKLLKIVHITLYGSFLYFLIVILPLYSIKLIKYLLSKMLFVIFIMFLFDALLKIYFDMNVDLIKFLDKNFYLDNPTFMGIINIISLVTNYFSIRF